MAKIGAAQNCVEPCNGCVRCVRGQCIAFEDPSIVWAAKACWGYERNKYNVALALYECVKYGLTKRFDAFVYAETETLLNEYLTEYDISQVEIAHMKNTIREEMQPLAEIRHGTNAQTNGMAQ